MVATGQATELGRISELLTRTTQLETPLTRQLEGVGRWITAAVVALSLVLFAYGYFARHSPLLDALVVFPARRGILSVLECSRIRSLPMRLRETSNAMTLAVTKLMLTAWDTGLTKGLAQNDSLFNEAIERKWVSQWLFYANSTRYASATGGADYGVFANRRYQLTANLQELLDYVGLLGAAKGK